MQNDPANVEPDHAGRPPYLRVAVSNAEPPHYSVPAWRQPSEKAAIILPKINVFRGHRKWDFECELLGMTTSQRNLVWRIALKDKERGLAFVHACDRVFQIWQVLEMALDWERREMLSIMLEHYPKAARRIMRGCARKAEGRL